MHTERPINADRVAGRARRVFNYWRTCRGGRGGGKGAIGGAERGERYEERENRWRRHRDVNFYVTCDALAPILPTIGTHDMGETWETIINRVPRDRSKSVSISRALGRNFPPLFRSCPTFEINSADRWMDKNRDRSRITDTGRIFFITRMFFVKIFDFFFLPLFFHCSVCCLSIDILRFGIFFRIFFFFKIGLSFRIFCY